MVKESNSSKYKDFDSYYKNESSLGRKEYIKELDEKAKIKRKEIQLANITKTNPDKKLPVRKFVMPGQNLSREQNLMQDMFGHKNQMWGTGRNLPVMNGALTTGYGLVNNGDFGSTGRLFGVRR